MKTRLLTIISASLLAFHAAPVAVLQDKDEHLIADFEEAKAISKNNTTHKAIVSTVTDTPKGGGKLAAKTVVAA